MGRSSREIAFQILFQSDFAPTAEIKDIAQVMKESSEEELNPENLEQARKLVEGVRSKITEIDLKIQAASQHWKIDRMASVDRCLLRLAVFEMVFSVHPLKPAIAINEAIEIAKKFGSTESASFVNGVLDQIGRGL